MQPASVAGCEDGPERQVDRFKIWGRGYEDEKGNVPQCVQCCRVVSGTTHSAKGRSAGYLFFKKPRDRKYFVITLDFTRAVLYVHQIHIVPRPP